MSDNNFVRVGTVQLKTALDTHPAPTLTVGVLADSGTVVVHQNGGYNAKLPALTADEASQLAALLQKGAAIAPTAVTAYADYQARLNDARATLTDAYIKAREGVDE